jgi:hypothetical protein
MGTGVYVVSGCTRHYNLWMRLGFVRAYAD